MSKSIKKSDHKHDYELVEMKEKRWFTHEKKCKICGHINNRIRVLDIEKAKFEPKLEISRKKNGIINKN